MRTEAADVRGKTQTAGASLTRVPTLITLPRDWLILRSLRSKKCLSPFRGQIKLFRSQTPAPASEQT